MRIHTHTLKLSGLSTLSEIVDNILFIRALIETSEIGVKPIAGAKDRDTSIALKKLRTAET